MTIRRVLERELDLSTADTESVGRIRIDAYRFRLSITGSEEQPRPFEWNPWTARRRIGLDCVRACIANPRLSPAQATRDTVDRLLRGAENDGSQNDTLADWLAGLPVGARGVVEAEAVLWTTQLLCALDWSQIPRPVIGADRSLVLLGARRVTLRSRLDVEVRASPGQLGSDQSRVDIPRRALFVMMSGQPSASARLELGFPALTVALDDRRRALPTMVVGWWPQSGRALILPVDVDLLLRTSEAVVEAVRSEIMRLPRRIGQRTERHHELEAAPLQRVAS